MSVRAAWVAVVLAAWACVAVAEGPATAPRPEARPVPDAPGRPVARGEANATQDDSGTGQPTALTEAPMLTALPEPAVQTMLAGPLSTPVPDIPRAVPTLPVTVVIPDTTGDLVPMPGPRQMVMAEHLMQEPPAPMVFVDDWTRGIPPLRPAKTDPLPGSGESALLRPEARPDTRLPVDATTVHADLRPRARPTAPVDPAPLVAAAPDQAPVYAVGSDPGVTPDAPQFSPQAVAVSLRPAARTAQVIQQASTVRRETARGAVCGDPGLQGEVMAAFHDGGGCGVDEPVRIRSVGGVTLSTPSIMDCNTAEALLSWVERSARPRLRDMGGGLAGLQIMGSYTCRPRNNQAGARLSEHGKGKAVDIGGFVLASGQTITVLDGWGTRAYGEQLRGMHSDACGPFGTVLGPNANAQHRNHFHFDTAGYRNGAYCR